VSELSGNPKERLARTKKFLEDVDYIIYGMPMDEATESTYELGLNVVATDSDQRFNDDLLTRQVPSKYVTFPVRAKPPTHCPYINGVDMVWTGKVYLCIGCCKWCLDEEWTDSDMLFFKANHEGLIPRDWWKVHILGKTLPLYN
jgi:hypothetical protein